MEKVAFIGSYDKADMLICVAKVLTLMKKKVIVIDTTALSKTRYIVPTMQSTKQYIAGRGWSAPCRLGTQAWFCSAGPFPS